MHYIFLVAEDVAGDTKPAGYWLDLKCKFVSGEERREGSKSVYVSEVTCGKSESDESRTFSGLRSQWTMFLLWRCFKATRI